jgi:PAS domain S-box-containing protein
MPFSGRYIDEESFHRLLQRAVIFPLILAIGMAGIFLWQVRSLLQVNRWVDEGDQIISKAEHLQLSITEMETRARGYILFGSQDFFDQFQEEARSLPGEVSALKGMLAGSPVQQAQLDQVEKGLQQWAATAKDALHQRQKAGSLAGFKPSGKGWPMMARVKSALGQVIRAEIRARNQRFAYARRTSRLVMWLGILLALLLGFVLSIFSRRALMRLSLSYQGAFTGLVKKSEELAESESRFRSMADASPVMIWTVDSELRCDWMSQEWERYTSRPFSSQAVTWQDIIHPEDREAFLFSFRQAAEEGRGLEAELRLRRRDEAYLRHLIRAVPLLNKGRNPNRWLLTATNIEEQKQSQEKVERALSQRDEFISVASHELKTPLTSLKLQLQMAKRFTARNQAPAIDRGLGISLDQVARITKLVDKLLDISRIQSGRLELDLEPVNLPELVREQIERFQGEIKRTGSEVRLDLPENAIVQADRFRIEQVFVNLFTNALKYGLGNPIEIKVQASADSVVLAVKDEGQGIAENHQQKIFERFQRAGAPKNVDGIGLGLYIAREVVSAHHGDISVHSLPGQAGSTFEVSLPISGA